MSLQIHSVEASGYVRLPAVSKRHAHVGNGASASAYQFLFTLSQPAVGNSHPHCEDDEWGYVKEYIVSFFHPDSLFVLGSQVLIYSPSRHLALAIRGSPLISLQDCKGLWGKGLVLIACAC